MGYVGSVFLRSKIPIEYLHKRTVGVTQASHTSVVLLKILLQHYYNVEPIYKTTDPNPVLTDMDAALIIGNEAMVTSSEMISYSYDLGELWLRKTGFPVVFAVFAVQENIISRFRAKISAVIQSYHDSLHCLRTEKERVIAAAQAKYPNIIYDIGDYYETLQFEVTKELKEALTFYLDMAAELKKKKKGARLRYL